VTLFIKLNLEIPFLVSPTIDPSSLRCAKYQSRALSLQFSSRSRSAVSVDNEPSGAAGCNARAARRCSGGSLPIRLAGAVHKQREGGGKPASRCSSC
jgi:hypothetical protein